MWNSDNFLKDFIKANNLDIFSKDCDLSIGKKIKKVLGLSFLGFNAFLFPNLAFTIGGGSLLYAFQKFKMHQLDNITADDVDDLSDDLDVSSLEEAREKKRENKEKIKGLKKDLKKAKFRRSLFLEANDVSLISTGLALGVCLFTPMAIPFAIGSSLLHGVLAHGEIKYTKKRMDLEKQVEAKKNIDGILDSKIADLEEEAENQVNNTLDNDNQHEIEDTNDLSETLDDNDNQHEIEDTNDLSETLDDDDIQFDPAENNNINDELNEMLDDDDIQFDPIDRNNTDIDDQISDNIDENNIVVDNDIIEEENHGEDIPNTSDVNSGLDNTNRSMNNNGINLTTNRKDDNYQVPAYNPLYEKAVDLYLDSLTVDYGRNRDSRIDEVINKVYSK